MKTSEFIKYVEGKGYVASKRSNDIRFSKNGETSFTISTEKINGIDTRWGGLLAPDVFEKAVEYAKTPIEEREEPKKYMIKDLSNGMYLRRVEIAEDHNRNIGLVQLVKKIEYCLTPFEITEQALERIRKCNISLENHEIKELKE